MLAYKNFVDKLTPSEREECCLVFHTQVVDENGTVHIHDRYHTHICYDELTEEDTDGNGFQEHEFTPEISYYQIPGYPFDYVCSASDQPIEPDAQLSSADDLLLIHNSGLLYS